MPSGDRGVTLIELIIAITIVSILAGIGATSYLGARSEKVLNGQINEIVADMRFAMGRSRAQEGGEQWGIHFENPSGSNNDFYEIWSGSSYASSTISRRITLSGGMVFTDPSDGTTEDVIFAKSTGLPTASSTIVVKSLTNSNLGTITISLQGVINY